VVDGSILLEVCIALLFSTIHQTYANILRLGLSVHMNQVHKENLTHVENATTGRQNLDIEIFGMEGVPGEIIEQHNQLVTEKHFAEEAERQRITGNPTRGAGEDGVTTKRARVHETIEEVTTRAAKWREDRRNGIARPVKVEVVANPVCLPESPIRERTITDNLQILPAQPTHFAPVAAAPPFPVQGQPGFPTAGLPGQPGFIPGQFPPPGGLLSTRPQSGILPTNPLSREPAVASEAAREKEKKARKGKDLNLVYFDESISPEEKMAKLPRFAEFMQT
jgi:hypothetical protein